MDEVSVRASVIGARATLVDIRQVSVSFKLENPNPAGLDGKTQILVGWVRKESHLHCQIEVKLNVTEFEDGAAVLQASVAYRATYLVDDITSTDDKDIDAFVKVSVTFSLWPYLREALHGLTARAGLPPFVLPTLKSPLDIATAESVLTSATTRRKSTQRTRSTAKKASARTKKSSKRG